MLAALAVLAVLMLLPATPSKTIHNLGFFLFL
jgi:hypothetical protein